MTAAATYSPLFIVIFAILMIWELIIKGIGLWKASKNNQVTWFIVMLVINTIGILPLIYLNFFQKKMPELKPRKKVTQKPVEKKVASKPKKVVKKKK